MELGFNNGTVAVKLVNRRRSAPGANWWFAQMRRVVSLAMEWKPAPPARPEQVYLPLGSH